MNDEIKYPDCNCQVAVDMDALIKHYAAVGIDLMKTLDLEQGSGITIENKNKNNYLTYDTDMSDLYSIADKHDYTCLTAADRSPSGSAEVEELKQKLEEKSEEYDKLQATFKEKSKEHDEVLAEKNHTIDVLRSTIMKLENKIKYCKKNGIWAEPHDDYLPTVELLPLLKRIFP